MLNFFLLSDLRDSALYTCICVNDFVLTCVCVWVCWNWAWKRKSNCVNSFVVEINLFLCYYHLLSVSVWLCVSEKSFELNNNGLLVWVSACVSESVSNNKYGYTRMERMASILLFLLTSKRKLALCELEIKTTIWIGWTNQWLINHSWFVSFKV